MKTVFDPKKPTIAYVDGFNLYHLALQDTAYRWSNPKLLLENVLGHADCIDTLKLYTARVSSKIDADAPRKQQVYLNALGTIPEIEITFGSFQVNDKWRRISEDMTKVFKPTAHLVRVVNPEEKGSDVNLGAHLLRDGFTGAYEQAIVCTNDTDLCEPIRIVVQEIGKPVFLITPNNKIKRPVPTAKKLVTAVGDVGNVFHMRNNHLKNAMLPQNLLGKGGKPILMPPSWANGAQKG
ncbi:NYN domain-containing protein [Ruegeria sp.]|uniref:NYN domain-containing protein n=1 Tax=Ruegeria sp. TaxID=1879320 RepID=UPI003B00F5A6